MIISPPFLLPVPNSPAHVDPLMDEVDKMTDSAGIYPVASDRRWHTGLHLIPSSDGSLPVRAVADGEVVAYRVCQQAIEDVFETKNTNAGFVLLKHSTETGEHRRLTFYSLYMHLVDLERMTTDGILPPPEGAPHSMPLWLREDTGGAIPGGGKKVRRKDVLGYVGQCQGNRHLHFEIFMTPGDFDAYFGATQVGREQVETPPGSDCWGRSYYLIPADHTFLAQPLGVDKRNQLNGIEFSPEQAGQNENPLWVEVYFHHGDKYTNVWSLAADGSRTALTSAPVREPHFEYGMYKRATALYPACPSDGYELLRFGRILSRPETLGERTAMGSNPRATWYCIPFASGQRGYIDVSKSSIKKLSDADFPFFMGWQKVRADAGVVDEKGLWDLDALKRLVRGSIGDAEALDDDGVDGNAATEVGAEVNQRSAKKKNEAMRRFIGDAENNAVRDLLHRFICEAPSEWDGAHLDTHYRHLLSEGGHFEGNEGAYDKLLDFVKKLQFWDKTDLPSGGHIWYFHPLAFIRHFRRCPWLTLKEQARLLPRRSAADAGGDISWMESIDRFSKGNDNAAGRFPHGMWLALNNMFVKYGFSTNLRKAHFLAQIFKETSAFRSASERGDAEYFRKMYEVYTREDAAYDFDHKRNWLAKLGFLKGRDRVTYISQRPGEIRRKAESNGNVEPGDGARFKGRGLIHLTWRNGYRGYEEFRGLDFTSDPNPELVRNDAKTAADSSGYFWVNVEINRKADRGSTDSDVKACFIKVGGAGGLTARQQFFRHAYFVLGDAITVPIDRDLVVQSEDGS